METRVIDTIRSAVQKLGVLAVGEELPQAEFRDCLVALNRVVDNYSTDGIFIGHTADIALTEPYIQNRCIIPTPTDESTAWKSIVTFGECGDFTNNPIEFINLFFRETNTDYPMREMSENEYGSIAVKNVSAIPSAYVHRSTGSGKSSLYFDYIPQSGLILMGTAKYKYTGTNSQGKPFTAIDTVNWDEGIEAMIVYRLAIELAPDYGISDISTIAGLLDDVESKIFAKNRPDLTMEVESSYSNAKSRDLRYNRARY